MLMYINYLVFLNLKIKNKKETLTPPKSKLCNVVKRKEVQQSEEDTGVLRMTCQTFAVLCREFYFFL